MTSTAARAFSSIALAAALAGCAASDSGNQVAGDVAYRSVMVGSADAQGFYFVPADQWMALGADDTARRAGLAGGPEPVKINTSVRMTVGQTYLLVPVCGGAAHWDKAIRPVILHQTGLSLAC